LIKHALLAFVFFVGLVQAQSVGTSIYTVAPQQVKNRDVIINFDSGYGVQAVRPFGEDGVEQRLGVVYGISQKWSLMSVAGALIEGNSTVRLGSAQVEAMRTLMVQDRSRVNLSAGVGFLKEYTGVDVLLARFALGRNFTRWNLNSNFVLEKPLVSGRDAVDVITTFTSAYRVLPWLWAGIDAIGEDLEGFFEPEEAEGGAKLMVGPTFRFRLSKKMHLRLGGGPIFYMTRNVPTSKAPRLLPSGDSGYAIRFSMIYGI